MWWASLSVFDRYPPRRPLERVGRLVGSSPNSMSRLRSWWRGSSWTTVRSAKTCFDQSRPSEAREALVAWLTWMTFFVAYSRSYGWADVSLSHARWSGKGCRSSSAKKNLELGWIKKVRFAHRFDPTMFKGIWDNSGECQVRLGQVRGRMNHDSWIMTHYSYWSVLSKEESNGIPFWSRDGLILESWFLNYGAM